MRHKYETRGIILARSPAGEANAYVTVLSPELGLVRARAQGLRRPGAKLAAALVTLAESELTLVRGKEGWRLTGAVLVENWFVRLASTSARERAARVIGLVLRLVGGDAPDYELYVVVRGFLEGLSVRAEDAHDSLEILAALYVLATLGLDTGTSPREEGLFSDEEVDSVAADRAARVARINAGIAASGL